MNVRAPDGSLTVYVFYVKHRVDWESHSAHRTESDKSEILRWKTSGTF